MLDSNVLQRTATGKAPLITKITGVGVSILVVGLAILNVRLAVDSYSLKRKYDQIAESRQFRPSVSLPTLRGVDKRGVASLIQRSPSNSTSLYLVNSSSCGACSKNWPVWKRLIDRLTRSSTKVRAVLLESGAQSDLPEDVASIPNLEYWFQVRGSSHTMSRLAMTPQTLVVDSEGKVRVIKAGVLSEADVQSIISVASGTGPR